MLLSPAPIKNPQSMDQCVSSFVFFVHSADDWMLKNHINVYRVIMITGYTDSFIVAKQNIDRFGYSVGSLTSIEVYQMYMSFILGLLDCY